MIIIQCLLTKPLTPLSPLLCCLRIHWLRLPLIVESASTSSSSVVTSTIAPASSSSASASSS